MMRVSVRGSVFALVMWMLLGCGSDEASPGNYNSLCKTDSDCDKGQGLICVGAGVNQGICSTKCAADADCLVHERDTKCVGAGINNGTCYTTCTAAQTCPSGHTCFMTATEAYSTCRAAL